MSTNGWEVIERAPRVLSYLDTPVDVLLYGPYIGVREGRAAVYPDGHAHADVMNINGNLVESEQYRVTHWMPKPEPPTD